MRFLLTAPRPLAQLVATILLTPSLSDAFQLGRRGSQGALAFNQLFARDCGGELCGWNSQLCCESGTQCYTDASDQAQCSTVGAVAESSGGYYSLYTTTYTETGLNTVTSVMSTYVGGATQSAQCNYALNETPCGGICCKSSQYCYVAGQCKDAGNGGSSGYYSTYTAGAGAPVAPTSSSLTTATETVTPTTTVPFLPPVATGANVTEVPQQTGGGGGLSGGAIAGIVIGVLAGLLLLGLICFYCCLRGLFEGCLALFGLGGSRKRKVTETDVYERRSHYSGGGGGRTWYGAARPARAERTDHRERNRLLGLGAGLAGLAAVLGMKRRHDRREEEKRSDYTYSSYDYTSASEYNHVNP
ncbi:hypothetical protein K431DRAFT_43162 [Polychaeton citri CBS 116435]|uniref:Uncharacterized protein n=1 Tax=Polychaeton citri CBS 116435 TaxID=1314669 RepID=A0A9P4Q8R0_9PEZI|nr:hypothetical protein K431DRAFT_43162 [Polychaeton citri CBS 116435]